MATLHTVNKNGQPLELCLRVVNKGDSLLLIEDGVYALFEVPDILAELIKDVSLYVLEADVLARGVSNRNELEIELVDYQGFVSLTETNEKTLSWF